MWQIPEYILRQSSYGTRNRIVHVAQATSDGDTIGAFSGNTKGSPLHFDFLEVAEFNARNDA